MKLTIEISEQAADYLRRRAAELGQPLVRLESIARYIIERAAEQGAAQQLPAEQSTPPGARSGGA